MLYPSYIDLMERVNNRITDEDEKLKSRYSIVIASAKRARQLIDGDEQLNDTKHSKHLSNAIWEIYEGKIDLV